MLLIRTSLAPSSIHGLGVVAREPISEGAPIWRFEPGIDQVIPTGTVRALPQAFQDYVATYGYHSPEFPGCYVLSCDNAKFLNHSETPNTRLGGRVTFAVQSIEEGEEITCDYRGCVLGWTGFD